MIAFRIGCGIALVAALSACGPRKYPMPKADHAEVFSDDARSADFKRRAAQIKIGMTRREVERLLPHMDGGLASLETGRYCEPPGLKAEVTFTLADPTRTSPGDIVSAPVLVYAERCAAD